MDKSKFLNKHCKISLKNGFVIDGIVTDLDTYGLTLENEKTTGFFSFDEISSMKVLD